MIGCDREETRCCEGGFAAVAVDAIEEEEDATLDVANLAAMGGMNVVDPLALVEATDTAETGVPANERVLEEIDMFADEGNGPVGMGGMTSTGLGFAFRLKNDFLDPLDFLEDTDASER